MDTNTYDDLQPVKRVDSSSSKFATTIGGDLDEYGNIHLTMEVPIEGTVDDSVDGNYATWTTLRFKNEDSCDYPEGNKATWDKEFELSSGTCTETFHSKISVPELLGCTGADKVKCYDANKDEVIYCDPDQCDYPPCSRCYPGQLLAARGYVKSALNGKLSSTATAENCHNFKICLPWIMEVESEIDLVKVPEFENNFILTRVSFECFDVHDVPCMQQPDKAWLIEIKSTAVYPWYVKEASDNGAHLALGDKKFDLVSIVNGEGCDQVDEYCEQTFHFQIPGCNSLEEEEVYEILGLTYDCYGDCDSLKEELEDYLIVEASITLVASQDNCGADFSIDATDSIDLEMNPYLEDYSTYNAVYVEGDATIGDAYFKIVATSNVPINHLNLLKLTSTVHTDTTDESSEVSSYEVEDCPAASISDGKPALCFKCPVSDLLLSAGDGALITINIKAEVEIAYTLRRERLV
jgi:hypothetical protein